MTPDTKALRALAAEATKGPWRSHIDTEQAWWAVYNTIGMQRQVCRAAGGTFADARYIAAVSPDVVLALLDRIEALKTQITRQKERMIEALADVCNAADAENAALLDELERMRRIEERARHLCDNTDPCPCGFAPCCFECGADLAVRAALEAK